MPVNGTFSNPGGESINKNKSNIVIVVCIILLSITAGLVFYNKLKVESYNELNIVFKQPEEVYEVESKLDAISFIASNSENMTDYELPVIDTTQIGEHVFIYIAIDKYGNRKEFLLLLNFSDPILPFIELTQNSIEITEGDKIDLMSFVKKAADPIDGDLDVSITKPKEYLKVGTHTIVYTVTDKNGNIVSEDLTLVVKAKQKSEASNDNSSKLPQNGSNEATGGNANGTEVSKQKPNNKMFLFADGFTILTAPKECQSYLRQYSGWAGGCYTIYDENGLPLGQHAIFE